MCRTVLYSSALACRSFFFFFNDTATTEIYTLSLHDALPISFARRLRKAPAANCSAGVCKKLQSRSEEHTSELQSQSNLVCRLLLEKKKQQRYSKNQLYRTYVGCARGRFHTLHSCPIYIVVAS